MTFLYVQPAGATVVIACIRDALGEAVATSAGRVPVHACDERACRWGPWWLRTGTGRQLDVMLSQQHAGRHAAPAEFHWGQDAIQQDS